MRKVGVIVFFARHDNFIDSGLKVPEKSGLLTLTRFFFDESTTYEEMVRILIQEGRLLPLDDPRLRYNFVLQAFEASWRGGIPLLPRSLSKPVTLREGQTLASTLLTHLVMDESEFEHYYLQKRINTLFCASSIVIRDSLSPKNTSGSAASDWGEVISTVKEVFVVTATAMSIVGGLDVIERRWKEWRTVHHAPSLQGTSQTSETDIVAIRLRMTHGPDHAFVEWLTDPDRLKHYIDAFSQPSSSIKPLQAIFVQRNDKALLVDVLEGVQNNPPLDTLLSYLNIDPK
jgi:hypothetical protein